MLSVSSFSSGAWTRLFGKGYCSSRILLYGSIGTHESLELLAAAHRIYESQLHHILQSVFDKRSRPDIEQTFDTPFGKRQMICICSGAV